jgi:DNA-binding NarL/FixJ family response regulator
MTATLSHLDDLLIPLPPNQFEALVVAASPQRRTALTASLRSFGARDVVEASGAMDARNRASQVMSRDVAVIDGSLSDGTALALIADLRDTGWRRLVLLSPRDDAMAIKGALAYGVRNYVVIREESFEADIHALWPAAMWLAGSDELSKREVEVLQLVAEGQSNKEVGLALGLSALTVKSHLTRIARKLGTGDRAEMVAIAMRRGKVR